MYVFFYSNDNIVRIHCMPYTSSPEFKIILQSTNSFLLSYIMSFFNELAFWKKKKNKLNHKIVYIYI